jgi:hypothetical protein
MKRNSEIPVLSTADSREQYHRIKQEFYRDEVVAYSADRKPMTRAQYVEKIECAIAQADSGELVSDEELAKEIETW